MVQQDFDITKIKALQRMPDASLRDTIVRTIQKLSSLSIEKKGTYAAGDLKNLFQYTQEHIPNTFSGIDTAPPQENVTFPNASAALLCLQALRSMGVGLKDRSKVAEIVLLNNSAGQSTSQRVKEKEVHEVMAEFKTNASLPLFTLTAIKKSGASFNGTGQYMAMHVKDLFTYAHGDIRPEIANIQDKEIIEFSNSDALVLCLDGLKDEDNSPENSVIERGWILQAYLKEQATPLLQAQAPH